MIDFWDLCKLFGAFQRVRKDLFKVFDFRIVIYSFLVNQ